MPTQRARNISQADLDAAARLKALWLAIPRERRPTQADMAEAWDAGGEANQSLISQYMNARIALNYRAVLFFAKALGVKPEQIRDDLPEQRLSGTSFAQPSISRELASQFAQLDADTIRAAHELIRGAYKDGGKVYNIEAEPDLFVTVYAKLRALRDQQQMLVVPSIVRDIDKYMAKGQSGKTGETDERDGRTGEIAQGKGKKRAAS